MVPEDSTGGLFDPSILMDRAVTQLAMDVPREVVTDVTGDGGEDYDLDSATVLGATDWTDDFSTVRMLEYQTQTDRADREPYLIDDEDWEIQRDPTNGMTLVFLTATPTTSETFRVAFTGKWHLDGTTNDLPDHYCEPVCHLAASYYFRRLKADANNSVETALNAGLVNLTGRSTGYGEEADYHERAYRDFFGLGADGRAAISTRRFEVKARRGDRYIWHNQP